MSNFLLHKHRKEDENFRRPEGLTELLSDISREVLRAQPECVYSFVADYLEAMLVTREQSLIAQRAFTTLVDLSMTICDMMRHVGISRDQAEQSGHIMEKEFKHAMTTEPRDGTSITEENALIVEGSILEKLRSKLGFGMDELCKTQRIIQVCFKDFYFREKEFALKLNRLPYDHWANQVEKTLEIYKNSGPARWELERAATAIQAGYRGYYSRKHNKDLIKMNKQATIIQSNFRGYLDRKKVALMLQEEIESFEEVRQTPLAPKQSLRSLAPISIHEVDSDEDSKEAVAATKIQAAYRGHRVRKHMQEYGYVPPTDIYDDHKSPREEFEHEDDLVQAMAATKIQAAYRGHLVRKNVKEPTVEKIEDIVQQSAEQIPAVEEEMPRAADEKSPSLEEIAEPTEELAPQVIAPEELAPEEIEPEEMAPEVAPADEFILLPGDDLPDEGLQSRAKFLKLPEHYDTADGEPDEENNVLFVVSSIHDL